MKSRKFNKEKYAEQKAMKKKNRPQRSYKSLGTTIEIPINHRKHKILATAWKLNPLSFISLFHKVIPSPSISRYTE